MTTQREAELAQRLLRWSQDHLRELPWRETRDPWAIHVAEVMLQQTQVDRVIPKWSSFLDRLPTASGCADRPAAEVIRLWDGLGYNRRALHLHAAAVVVRDRHGGTHPADLPALLDLPGVGAYTARAILAFAFEQDVAVVDTNVGRVLARWEGTRLTPAEAQASADALVPAAAGWRWNQTVLDFGALCCTKQAPHCSACPVAELCTWQGEGTDPAVRSAGVSGPQSTFEGSDRQGRGRLVKRLREGPVPEPTAAAVMGWADDLARADRVLAGLIRDGLVLKDSGLLRLP